MKKILFLISILGMTACSGANQDVNLDINPDIIEATDVQVNCPEIEDLRKRGVCEFNLIIDEAIETNNDTLCETVNDDYLRSNCKQSVKDAN